MSISETTQEAEGTRTSERRLSLSSLACHAAIELDNLILGRGTDLSSVWKLAERLSTEVSD